MSPDRALFLRHAPVSRETKDKLSCYHDLLKKWNRAINLVGRTTEESIWTRHFLDSAQILSHMTKKKPSETTLVDFGSGAGFPALVLALLGVGAVHAVESDRRKALFLAQVVRETGCDNVTIHHQRVEKLTPFPVDYITARAFAPLSVILQQGKAFCDVSRETEFLLLKGRRVDEELTAVQKRANIIISQETSLTDPTASVLRVREGDS